jgi:hypothetical protein
LGEGGINNLLNISCVFIQHYPSLVLDKLINGILDIYR